MSASAASPRPGPTARQVVESGRLLAIAHRGASTVAPENTLPAFQAALEIGGSEMGGSEMGGSDVIGSAGSAHKVDLVELDYRESADGVPVVFHDELLDRTTDACARWRQAKIPLAGKRLADLCTLDAGSWFSGSFAGVPIPTLVEAIRLITPVAIALIERKAGPADRCIDLLRNADAIDRVVVQAFDWNYLADCHRLAPELVLAALGEDELTTDRLDEICRRQFPLVAWDHERLSADLVNQIHARGLRIFAWTVDDPARMRTLAALGVDGIITNCPHLLVAIRREIGGA